MFYVANKILVTWFKLQVVNLKSQQLSPVLDDPDWRLCPIAASCLTGATPTLTGWRTPAATEAPNTCWPHRATSRRDTTGSATTASTASRRLSMTSFPMTRRTRCWTSIRCRRSWCWTSTLRRWCWTSTPRTAAQSSSISTSPVWPVTMIHRFGKAGPIWESRRSVW